VENGSSPPFSSSENKGAEMEGCDLFLPPLPWERRMSDEALPSLLEKMKNSPTL